MSNRISEFKLWSVAMVIGTVMLSTEVAVKATRPAPSSLEPAMSVKSEVLSVSAISESHLPPAPTRNLPETLVTSLLVESIIQVESAGKSRMVGSKGERGLMQIMSGTWRETTSDLYGRAMSFQRAFEPGLNREVGTAYLARLHEFLQQHRNHWQADERSLLLACYNAGPQRVAQANFNLRRLPASTRDYVSRASALHDLYLKEHALRLAPAGKFAMEIIQADARIGRDS